jgi:hypothetical protein
MSTGQKAAIRIPNVSFDKMVDENGFPTTAELMFRETLITQLQDNFGNEGCVVPGQSAANCALIQNHTEIDPVTSTSVPTCGFGRILYDSTNKRILISVDNGSGIPVFMQVGLTIPVPPLP